MAYTYDFPMANVCVDNVILAHGEHPLEPKVLLIRRANDPFAGFLCLPGGFLDPLSDPSLEYAARRELDEETHLPGAWVIPMEQLGAYGDINRDPRARTVTVAHYAVLEAPLAVRADDDADHADWYNVVDIYRGQIQLGFDHLKILKDAVWKGLGLGTPPPSPYKEVSNGSGESD